MPPTDAGSMGGDVLKALAGTDAVACAAGAGQIPGRGTALEQAAVMRDTGTTLDSVVEGLHAVGLSDGKPQVSVPAGVPYPYRVLIVRYWEGRAERGVILLLFIGPPPLASDRAIGNLLSILGFPFFVRRFLTSTCCGCLFPPPDVEKNSLGGHILVFVLHFSSSL